MRPRIVEWLNQIFHTNFFSYLIPNYTIMFSISLLLTLILFIRRVDQEQLNKVTALSIYFWGIIGIFLGGKLYGIIESWLQGSTLHVELFRPSQIGMVSIGGLFGGLIGIMIYGYLKKISVLAYLDTVAPFLGIAIFLMRIGCFLNGDDYGSLSFLPWAVQYPQGSYPFEDQVSMGLIKPFSEHSLPLHPVQVYSGIMGLAIFGILCWTKKYNTKNGVQFSLFLLSYFIFRFFLEFFRGDPGRLFLGAFSHVQILSFIIVPVSIIFLIFLSRQEFSRKVSLVNR